MDLYMHTVPVIASFNRFGEIKPLYVMIEGIQLKIIESYTANHAGIKVYHIFNCIVDDNGIQKSLKLNYNHSDHIWTVAI